MCKNTTPARDGTNFFSFYVSQTCLMINCNWSWNLQLQNPLVCFSWLKFISKKDTLFGCSQLETSCGMQSSHEQMSGDCFSHQLSSYEHEQPNLSFLLRCDTPQPCCWALFVERLPKHLSAWSFPIGITELVVICNCAQQTKIYSWKKNLNRTMCEKQPWTLNPKCPFYSQNNHTKENKFGCRGWHRESFLKIWAKSNENPIV